MLLNHFADPFQNGHASVDQFFSESNHLTEQFNPAYGGDNQVGYGFAENPAGYEWAGQDDYAGGGGGGHGGGGHAQEFRSNGGYHQQIPQQQCGSDPHSLARRNIEWENRMQTGEHLPGQPGYESHRRGASKRPSDEELQREQEQQQPAYIYSGPDDLDYDDETVAPPKGMEYWKKRVPTLLIHGGAIVVWMWLWSSFGFSKILANTTGSILYWSFIILMLFGAMQADHRAGLYAEEREQMTSIESNLKVVVKIVAITATLLLSFEILKKRSNGEQYAAFSALGISFFVGLVGLMSFTSKKRGEHIRRYRKIKGVALNLSIGLMAVAALICFGMIGAAPQTNVVVKQKGGNMDAGFGPTRTVKVLQPAEKIQVELIPQKPIVEYVNANVDQGLQELAPAPAPTMSTQGQQGFMGAPTVLQPNINQQGGMMNSPVAPTMPRYY